MYLKEALPLVKLLEAEPPRMGSQPLGWELVRARAVSFLSAIRFRSKSYSYFLTQSQRNQNGIPGISNNTKKSRLVKKFDFWGDL